ncbi:F-box domain-containing protein [Mycena chlorophos]|uniref:F-box domain-containing protein n=1 Tax=Mycena chlorophos TaxID=658473 RepID=A0A8H6WKJ4_MYCCL|nr:F-box domain-containing protein [Mycena chlorophos]
MLHLPDEIILQILAPAFDIPDEHFADPSQHSPFAKYRFSSAEYLSVCKSWLRVGTPLLYQTCILRCEAQTAALEWTLQIHPEFGRYIRRLRLEVIHAAPLRTVLRGSPNIRELAVAINAHSELGEDVNLLAGLARALSAVKPTRIVLFDARNIPPRDITSLLILPCLINDWKPTVFELPEIPSGSLSPLVQLFAEALGISPNLQTIVIPFVSIVRPQETYHLADIARNPNIQRIRMRSPSSWSSRQIISFDAITQHPVLSRIVELPIQQDEHDPIVDTSRLQYSTSHVPGSIWQLIMRFTLSLDPDDPRPDDRKPYLGLLTVCKLFQRIAQPYLHSAMVFRGSYALIDFLQRLERNPSLRPGLRALFFELPKTAWTVSLEQLFDDELLPLNITTLVGIEPLELSTRLFDNFGQTSGNSLTHIDGIILTRDHGKESPALFGAFRALRTLCFESCVYWHVTDIPSDALPMLERLYLCCTHPGSESLVRVLAGMRLTSLRHVAFINRATIAPRKSDPPSALSVPSKLFVAIKRFLGAHGPAKLKSLNVPEGLLQQDAEAPRKYPKLLELCDRLEQLEVECGSNIPRPKILNFSESQGQVEATVQRIAFAFKREEMTRLQRMGLFFENNWVIFFYSLDLRGFPHLGEIALAGLRWPETEQEIADSQMVTAAEQLLDGGVRLVDGDGLGWRPKLQRMRRFWRNALGRT